NQVFSLRFPVFRQRRSGCTFFLLVLFFVGVASSLPVPAQLTKTDSLKGPGTSGAPIGPVNPPSAAAAQTKRIVTINDAVSLFLQQNLNLVAARYDIDTVDAEKLSAAVRPNPEITVGTSG